MSGSDYKAFKCWEVAGRRVTYVRRGRHARMGRFGGSWRWALGIQASPSTVIVNLLVAYVRIELGREVTR